jgi:hypothetical protein
MGKERVEDRTTTRGTLNCPYAGHFVWRLGQGSVVNLAAPTGAPATASTSSAVTPADTAVITHVITHRGILRQVIRNAVPHLIEATMVPALLFYVAILLFGTWVAFIVALSWAYGAIARRLLLGQSVPPILLLSTIALTVRTAIAIASGSTFIYFFQPILGTVAMACVFLGSIAIGKPLIGKLASDFWPLHPEVAELPAVKRLFLLLTILWAGVNFATAATTFVLLLTMPVEGFVPAKMLSGYVITCTGIIVTIALSIATARREGLVGAALAMGRVEPAIAC